MKKYAFVAAIIGGIAGLISTVDTCTDGFLKSMIADGFHSVHARLTRKPTDGFSPLAMEVIEQMKDWEKWTLIEGGGEALAVFRGPLLVSSVPATRLSVTHSGKDLISRLSKAEETFVGNRFLAVRKSLMDRRDEELAGTIRDARDAAPSRAKPVVGDKGQWWQTADFPADSEVFRPKVKME